MIVQLQLTEETRDKTINYLNLMYCVDFMTLKF